MEECHTGQDLGMWPPRPPPEEFISRKGISTVRKEKIMPGKGYIKFSHQRTP